MAFREKVRELLEDGLSQNPSLFLIDLSISESNKITVILDGDNGVTLQDCIDISRAIEHNLDREEVDFSLEVASAGATALLKTPRQYHKNIGRSLLVKTITGETIEALLKSSDDNNVLLEWEAREPKKVGKGKETVSHSREIPYSDIKEASVTIVF